jgi:hypothetical protein
MDNDENYDSVVHFKIIVMTKKIICHFFGVSRNIGCYDFWKTHYGVVLWSNGHFKNRVSEVFR